MELALQLLWSLRNEQLSIHKISEMMQLSTKQVTRKIKKWETEGWIRYCAGKGRGHISSIQWLQDIEKQLLIVLNSEFKQKNFKALTDINMSYFSEKFQQNVAALLTENIVSDERKAASMLTIPIYSKNLNLHPHNYSDTESGWVLSHIYSRIVIQNNNTFKGDLIHHWEQFGQCFIFYVRPFLYWHNGETVKIEEIMQSIKTTFMLNKYSYFFRKVISIEKRTNAIFEIKYIGGEEELLTLLSQLDFSLYHPLNYRIGTGAYKIAQDSNGAVQLTACSQYHLTQALINKIQFVTIPSTLQRRLEWSMQQNEAQYQSCVELGGIVSTYFNPFSNNLQKREVRLYMLWILKRFAQQIGQVDSLKSSCVQEILTSLQRVSMPALRIGYIVNQTKFIVALHNFCEEQGIQAEVIKLTIDDLPLNKLFTQVDLIIIGEYLAPPFILENDKEHPLSIILENVNDNTWFAVLYKSFREIYYPSNFRRSVENIYGYPNLTTCWFGC
ncbi:SgrR family transcriptional regulator [Metasolibacillus fluoroglycofenilyticus]|uniref:SgrR family transcriptional regulator n=1 Tax=Metasolibacillus fluoroglycofenilyticus TaxID=1239396 RepID=UPI000D3D472E|nr:SgrR family transcriptional regulator [Metasolibacillus fluoroglycofenilyticus]